MESIIDDFLRRRARKFKVGAGQIKDEYGAKFTPQEQQSDVNQSLVDNYCEGDKMIITEKQILKLISIAREYQCYLGTIGFRSAKHYSQELKEFLAEIHNQQPKDVKVIEQ